MCRHGVWAATCTVTYRVVTLLVRLICLQFITTNIVQAHKTGRTKPVHDCKAKNQVHAHLGNSRLALGKFPTK
jgi:hypothetical protein